MIIALLAEKNYFPERPLRKTSRPVRHFRKIFRRRAEHLKRSGIF
ncbi:hypothetical protein B4135_3058 [Caldibacillus debilis]|uniref:Uncharacterized protein n=1 Tax=Caldibacillus debilis TaxID=301148 RepID=A0A150LJQ4_9BACI|nr:hypothetical protein B4135_3058 [Caldibacillus debilis]